MLIICVGLSECSILTDSIHLHLFMKAKIMVTLVWVEFDRADPCSSNRSQKNLSHSLEHQLWTLPWLLNLIHKSSQAKSHLRLILTIKLFKSLYYVQFSLNIQGQPLFPLSCFWDFTWNSVMLFFVDNTQTAFSLLNSERVSSDPVSGCTYVIYFGSEAIDPILV